MEWSNIFIAVSVYSAYWTQNAHVMHKHPQGVLFFIDFFNQLT